MFGNTAVFHWEFISFLLKLYSMCALSVSLPLLKRVTLREQWPQILNDFTKIRKKFPWLYNCLLHLHFLFLKTELNWELKSRFYYGPVPKNKKNIWTKFEGHVNSHLTRICRSNLQNFIEKNHLTPKMIFSKFCKN